MSLPPQSWSAGITAVTTVFAFGQIVGPSVAAWIAGSVGGLERSLHSEWGKSNVVMPPRACNFFRRCRHIAAVRQVNGRS